MVGKDVTLEQVLAAEQGDGLLWAVQEVVVRASWIASSFREGTWTLSPGNKEVMFTPWGGMPRLDIEATRLRREYIASGRRDAVDVWQDSFR